MSVPMCRFDDGHKATARFKTPNGCACYPADREQDLCAQHIVKWGIIDGGVELLAVYDDVVALQLGIAME
jgi:hypothetical protein